jgi:S-adenosylmethionine decarboxylase
MRLGRSAFIKLNDVPMQWVTSLNIDVVMNTLWQLLKINGATPVSQIEKKFRPDGYTACIILKESHLVIHTWPEKKVMTIDLFFCGRFKFKKFMRDVKSMFRPAYGELEIVTRK